jgi:hypothetical protein
MMIKCLEQVKTTEYILTARSGSLMLPALDKFI